jgi:hypothetical protein
MTGKPQGLLTLTRTTQFLQKLADSFANRLDCAIETDVQVRYSLPLLQYTARTEKRHIRANGHDDIRGFDVSGRGLSRLVDRECVSALLQVLNDCRGHTRARLHPGGLNSNREATVGGEAL